MGAGIISPRESKNCTNIKYRNAKNKEIPPVVIATIFENSIFHPSVSKVIV